MSDLFLTGYNLFLTEYHKIETIFNRDTNGTKKLIGNDFRNKTVEYLADIPWIWTEKINGTNIRVCWDGYEISFMGRTNKADIPKELKRYLDKTFKTDETEQLFEQLFGSKTVVLYGEGYGGKIQNGSGYRDDESFILFDIMINDIFLERENVENIASTFGIDVVPIVRIGNLYEAVDFINTKPKSLIADTQMEGIVCRPMVEIKDRMDNRLIVKIKVKDF